MKFFFLILSFAMLYMSCLPCGDSKECNAKTEAKISATDNHEQHKHNAEACTPFCTCSCCAASVFYSHFSKAQVNKVMLSSEIFPLHNVAFTTEAHKSIWQPPRLS